ncbi:MAG: Ig-like domain-containing protein, partial [Actinomycetes bacterium]
MSEATSTTWTVDTTPPPTPQIQGTANGNTQATATTITFSGEDGGSFACSRNYGDFTPCSSPAQLNDLGDGSYSYRVIQTDVAGNASPEASISWTVDTTPPGKPGQVKAVQVASGLGHSCAVMSDATVRCWGDNSYGQLGDGSTRSSSLPVRVQGLDDVKTVTLGAHHSCALMNDGSLQCWGDNSYAQLGTGDTNGSLTPRASLVVGTNLQSVSAGGDHTCGLDASGATLCWGRSDNYELGDGTASRTVSRSDGYLRGTCSSAGSSQQVTGSYRVGSGSYGYRYGGYDGNGNYNPGRGYWYSSYKTYYTYAYTYYSSCPFSASPVRPSVSAASQLSSGTNKTCVVTQAGGVNCWGSSFGSTPTAVSGVSGASRVATGDAHACAVEPTGTVKCWGRNALGQLGNGSSLDSDTGTTAFAVVGISNASDIVAQSNGSCAVLSTGRVVCWGDNISSQLGTASVSGSSPVPWLASGVAGLSQIAAGSNHSCVVQSGGGVICWGAGSAGQLGNGTFDDSARPVRVAGLEGYPALTGDAATLQITGEDQAAFTCSLDGATYAACNSPVALSGLTDGNHTLSIKQTDQAGNTSEATTINWTVDTSVPTAPSISGAPAIFTNKTTTAIAVTGEDQAAFTCSLDGATYA